MCAKYTTIIILILLFPSILVATNKKTIQFSIQIYIGKEVRPDNIKNTKYILALDGNTVSIENNRLISMNKYIEGSSESFESSDFFEFNNIKDKADLVKSLVEKNHEISVKRKEIELKQEEIFKAGASAGVESLITALNDLKKNLGELDRDKKALVAQQNVFLEYEKNNTTKGNIIQKKQQGSILSATHNLSSGIYLTPRALNEEKVELEIMIVQGNYLKSNNELQDSVTKTTVLLNLGEWKQIRGSSKYKNKKNNNKIYSTKHNTKTDDLWIKIERDL